jgi:hypothetical protein
MVLRRLRGHQYVQDGDPAVLVVIVEPPTPGHRIETFAATNAPLITVLLDNEEQAYLQDCPWRTRAC